MNLFRLKTSDIKGVQIDAEWQQFLLKDHKMTSNIGDYFYEDVQGNMRVMSKDKFERLFDPIDTPLVQQSWLQKLIPTLAT
jgi:hypothetical protein